MKRNALIEIRKNCGKSQQEVSDYLNIHRTTYIRIEEGKGALTDEQLIQLASFFGCSIDSLLGVKTSVSNEDILEEVEDIKSRVDDLYASLKH